MSSKPLKLSDGHAVEMKKVYPMSLKFLNSAGFIAATMASAGSLATPGFGYSQALAYVDPKPLNASFYAAAFATGSFSGGRLGQFAQDDFRLVLASARSDDDDDDDVDENNSDDRDDDDGEGGSDNGTYDGNDIEDEDEDRADDRDNDPDNAGDYPDDEQDEDDDHGKDNVGGSAGAGDSGGQPSSGGQGTTGNEAAGGTTSAPAVTAGPDRSAGPTETPSAQGQDPQPSAPVDAPTSRGVPRVPTDEVLPGSIRLSSGANPVPTVFAREPRFEPYYENNVSSHSLENILAYFDLADRFANLADDGTVDIVWLKFEERPMLKGLNALIDGTRHTPDLAAAVGPLVVMVFLDQATLRKQSDVIPVFGNSDAADAIKATRRPLR